MTCIVGLIEGKKVWLGGDSAAAGPNVISTVSHSKVFKSGVCLIGYTASFRLGDLLEFAVEPKDQRGVMIDRSVLVKQFVPMLQTILEEGKFQVIKDEQAESGGAFLIATPSGLFEVQEDYSVLQHAEPYTAIGSGFSYATGALHALCRVRLPAREKVKRALDAAAYHCPTVRPPYTIKSVGLK